MIGDGFVYVSNGCLSSVCVHYQNTSDVYLNNMTSRTRSHVTENLSAVNAYPIESGMRKDVAIKLNVNERHQMKQLNGHVIPKGKIVKIYYHRKKFSDVP